VNDDTRRLAVFREAWRTQLWPMPALGVLAAAALGVWLPAVDARATDSFPDALTGYLFSGGPEAARTVLSVIAGSLITVTSLTFSLTVVTLQLASSQFSPRLLRTFTRDRVVHATLALLLSTFTYALAVLRTVRATIDSPQAFVPQISVTVAFLLCLSSVLGLVAFLAHLARQLRVESLLKDVHAETSEVMSMLLTRSSAQDRDVAPPAAPPSATPLLARRSGFLTSTDERALASAAVDADAVVSIERLPGDILVAGTPLGSVWHADGTPLDESAVAELGERVSKAVRTGFERTAAEDIAFGLRQLVDVAVKALSPGINDPTTAVHALGHVSALLCEAAKHDLGSRVVRDDHGRVRVVLRRPDLRTLLDLALTQPRRYGAGDPEVFARLFQLLRELAWSTSRPERRHLIEGHLDILVEVLGRQDFCAPERRRLENEAGHVRQALEDGMTIARPNGQAVRR
jgi:uncharacterized membrane protein